MARSCTFSRALCRLRVITSSFDWFTGLSPSFLIGQSNYFGFGFTKLDWNSLYLALISHARWLVWAIIPHRALCLHRNFTSRQEPMTGNEQQPYIPVTTSSQTNLLLDWISREWDSHRNFTSITNHKKLTWRHSVTEANFRFVNGRCHF